MYVVFWTLKFTVIKLLMEVSHVLEKLFFDPLSLIDIYFNQKSSLYNATIRFMEH